MSDAVHRNFMARAIKLAAKGMYTTDPNPRVGCVLVKDDTIIGEGWHIRAGEPHAEVYALRAAGDAAKGASVYVSLEPCSHHGRTPPCVNALIKAEVAKVYIGMQDPNPQVAGQGIEALKQRGIFVETGLLEIQARALNPGFIKRMQTGLPYVRSKIAMSMDGATAMAAGESQWITGGAAREDVHRWRARSSAIMTGIGTVLADDPQLTVRMKNCEVKYQPPIRIIIDSQLRTPPKARVLNDNVPTLIYTTVTDAVRVRAVKSDSTEVIKVGADNNRVNLVEVLHDLAARNINEVLVECGATLNGALLQAGLLDEVLFYVAPCILGGETRGAFELPGLSKLSEKMSFAVVDTRQIGEDWRIMCVPDK